LAQSQAICRYLARRANIAGNNSVEEVKIDMVAEAVNDVLPLVMGVPFLRKKSLPTEEFESQMRLAKVKWHKLSSRLEAILRKNGGVYIVGESLSYADVLVGHMTTWFVEEV
jgi:glutathione S-transferase